MKNENDLPRVTPRSRREIEDKASLMITDFRKEYPHEPDDYNVIQFLHFLERKGLFAVEVVEQLAGSKEGEYRPFENVIVLKEETYRLANDGSARSRFTVPHEIGHALLHGNQLRVVTRAGLSVARFCPTELKAYENPEWQANAYAAACLMPAELAAEEVRQITGRGLGIHAAIESLERRFRVSKSAASNRIADLRKLGVLK